MAKTMASTGQTPRTPRPYTITGGSKIPRIRPPRFMHCPSTHLSSIFSWGMRGSRRNTGEERGVEPGKQIKANIAHLPTTAAAATRRNHAVMAKTPPKTLTVCTRCLLMPSAWQTIGTARTTAVKCSYFAPDTTTKNNVIYRG